MRGGPDSRVKYSTASQLSCAICWGATQPCLPGICYLCRIWQTETSSADHVCASSPVAPCPVRSGVYNDLGSGSNVDLCIITADGVEYLRNHEMLQGKTYSRQFPVRYPPGTARE